MGGDRTVAALVRQHTLAVLAECGGNKDAACAVLEMSRSWLDVKLHDWGVADQWRRTHGRNDTASAIRSKRWRARRREMRAEVAA
jgi:hypothetical protein